MGQRERQPAGPRLVAPGAPRRARRCPRAGRPRGPARVLGRLRPGRQARRGRHAAAAAAPRPPAAARCASRHPGRCPRCPRCGPRTGPPRGRHRSISSSRSRGDDDDPHAARRQRPDPLADHAMVRTSRPWVGLLNTTTRGSNASSRASSAFWMLPPTSLPMACRRDGVRMSNSRDELARGGVDGGPVDGAPAPVGRLADALEHEVDAHRVATDDALVEAVVRDVAEAQAAGAADTAGPVIGRARETDLAGARLALAGDDLRERALAVAVDAGDAQDLAPVDRRATTSRDAVLAARAGRRDAGQLQHRIGGRHGRAARLRDGSSSRAARRCRRRGCGLAEHDGHDALLEVLRAIRRAGRRGPAGPPRGPCLRTRDPVADGDRLVELVGDEDDGQARWP